MLIRMAKNGAHRIGIHRSPHDVVVESDELIKAILGQRTRGQSGTEGGVIQKRRVGIGILPDLLHRPHRRLQHRPILRERSHRGQIIIGEMLGSQLRH